MRTTRSRLGHVLADRVGVAQRPQVVDAVELGARRRAAAGRWPPWRSGRCRTTPAPGSTAWPRAPRCRASGRWSASSARPTAPPTIRRGGRRCPRATPCPGGSPSSRAGGCRAGRARARPGGSSPRPRTRAATVRSWRRRGRHRPADDRRAGQPPDGAVRRELRGDRVLEPRIQHDEHLVAGLDHGVGLRHEPAALAQDRDDQAALGQLDVRDAARRRPARPRRPSISMISRRSSSRSSRWTSPYWGTSCSISRRIRSVADTAGWMPSSWKCWRLRGLLTRATIALAEVLVPRHLADEDVVLVVAGHGDHQVGALDAGALEDPQLGRVAVLDARARAPARPAGSARGRCSMQRHLVALLDAARGRGSSRPCRRRR